MLVLLFMDFLTQNWCENALETLLWSCFLFYQTFNQKFHDTDHPVHSFVKQQQNCHQIIFRCWVSLLMCCMCIYLKFFSLFLSVLIIYLTKNSSSFSIFIMSLSNNNKSTIAQNSYNWSFLVISWSIKPISRSYFFIL